MYSVKRLPVDRRRRGGFSLLEALATTAVVAIGLLGFSMNSVSMTKAQKHADAASAAIGLAQEKLERLRSMPLGAAGHATGSYQDSTTFAADGTVGGPYTRTWTVSQKDQPSYGLKTVTVHVSWNDPESRSTSLSAMVRCSASPCP